MSMLPTGNVTFLFTDIEGSTPLFQQHPDAMPRALARHNELLQSNIAAHNGQVFQIIGDAFCAAFENADDAVCAALEAQRALYAEAWGELGALRVRMGIHAGNVETQGDTYISYMTLARAQRIMSAAHGGQMLLSSAAAELVRGQLPTGVTLRELGAHKLRGVAQPEVIYQLVAADLPAEFPPLRVVEVGAADASSLLDHLVRGKLIGRRSELEQLARQWQQAQQARGHLVLVSGEPGVGKTRLAQELGALAQKEGALVLHGGCYEYEATTPYLPFVEALRDWVHWSSPEQLRVELGATAPEILKFAPEIETKLGALTPNPSLEPNGERLRLFDNVARLVQTLAAPRGLVFFIDDLHWADQGTLSLLHYLLRHLRNSRVLFLAAYREVELDRTHPLSAALVDWNRERLATRIALGRLTREDTAGLLAALFGQASVSDEFVDVLFRETEGNPFFLEEVVKALIEQGSIYREGETWGRKEVQEMAVPQSVKDAIGRRLNRLQETTVNVLHTAAAIGKQFPFRELAIVSTANEDELLDALDEASAAQLVRANADDSFTFTHDKIREVLYEELNPVRRRRLHQRIGESFVRLYGESGDGHVQDIAYHFAQSGDLEKSLTYARRAADSAARVFAHDDARRFLDQAREAAEALNQPETLAQIEERRGDLYRAQGLMTDAIASYERALKRIAEGERRAILHVKIGEVYANIGDPRGLDYLQCALKELDPETNRLEYAQALAHLGRYHHYRTEHARAIQFLQQARALAEPLDDASTLTRIYTYLAGAYQHILEFDTSNEWARASMALGERHNSPGSIALGYEFLSENGFNRGHWQTALEYGERNHQIGEKIGALDRMGWADFSCATALYGMGELAKAREIANEGIELAERIGEGRLATWIDPLLTMIASDMGEDELAQKLAARSLTRGEQLGQIVLLSWSLHAVGYWHLHRGDGKEAAAYYTRYLDLVAPSENGAARLLVMASAAEALLGVGDVERAAQVVQEAVIVAERGKAPHRLALARRVQGQIALAQQDWETAGARLDEAIEVFQELGSRLELARALGTRAKMWEKRGNEDAAKLDDERAAVLFEECGAVN
ncbi:MAG TPA: AAA family ATPase [Anaerolineae bacterium]|nr:AAA family ATPase [Anaerolineae bacterium]